MLWDFPEITALAEEVTASEAEVLSEEAATAEAAEPLAVADTEARAHLELAEATMLSAAAADTEVKIRPEQE